MKKEVHPMGVNLIEYFRTSFYYSLMPTSRMEYGGGAVRSFSGFTAVNLE